MTDIIDSPLRTHVENRHGDPVIITGDTHLTWRDLANSIGRLKSWLAENGFAEGDVLAWVLQGSWRDVALFLACTELGVIFCALNARWPAAELHQQAKRLGARWITTPELAAADDVPHPSPLNDTWQLQRPVSIIFTSGSTGEPKAVLHTLGNHYFNALGSNENISLNPGDSWQLSLPLYHVSGMGIVFRSVIAGSAMVISTHLNPENLINNRVTHLSLVSTQFRRLLDEPGVGKLGNQLRAILLGGGPIPQNLIHAGEKLNLPVFVSYGLSEMASQVATTTPDQADKSRATILPYREVKISTDGEILVRGETLFAGYLLEHGLESARDAQGWFHTRDVGDMVGKQLQVTGRLDNQFISGGENIQPEMIERALVEVAGIESAVVVPVPDAVFQLRPFAFYTSDRPVKKEVIRDALRQVLPGYMIPVDYTVLPKALQSGLKPSRKKLTALAVKRSSQNS
ncbi:MAG: o-succinylbenzoate--CoA ligase [Lentisphaeria bacterium]|nr:o-succinylbenzoate--CoA ligase [Candidatus Neomarinimicrobiota bacterium]MCF7843010.1 o-succinylbenzoate--CoA ligase [Lentisphaeria bacterium]